MWRRQATLMLRVVFMSLHLMWSKNSLLFVFVKPKLYCFNHSYALQVSFFSLITNVVVTSSFWLCSKFCADTIATFYVFEGATWTYPLFRPVARATTTFQTCQIWTPAKVPRPAVECPSDAQRNACTLRLFQALWKSAVFGRVFPKKLLFSAADEVDKICLWFFQFLFQWSDDNKFAQCSQES